MEIQAKTYYALLVLVDLYKNTALSTTTMTQIAERNKLSSAFLKKIIHQLVVSGFVKSVRGPSGGYQLASSIQDISLYQVLEAMGQSLEFKSALSGEQKEVKAINNIFKQLHEEILTHFKSIKIHELAE